MRPEMYIGRLGNGEKQGDGIYVLLRNIIDNSVKEFQIGHGREIEVTVTPDGGESKSFTLKKMSKDMRHLDWFGFVADGDNDANCWLDNINLMINE